MDIDTVFDQIRQNLIDLISREITNLQLISARVQMNRSIRFRIEHKEGIINRVRLAFNSRITDIFQGSGVNEMVNRMFTYMKTQIKNPTLANSRYLFDEVLFMDINFHQLNLTQRSSYLPRPVWVSIKGGVINPQNLNDEECLKWAVIAGLHYVNIRSHTERISNLRRFEYYYDWDGLEFPSYIKGISEFERRNDVIIIVLGVEEKKF